MPDVIIIGGGIAGASAGYFLAEAGARVLLLEREAFCGYHSTGRSAASFTETYGNAVIRRLAKASRGFLENAPPGFAEHPLVRPRGTITIARADQHPLIEAALEGGRAFCPDLHAIDPAEAIERVPVLRRDYVAAALYEPGALDIDVNELHQGYLRGFRRCGGVVRTETEVGRIDRQDGRWQVAGEAAPVLVNAAGAWADEVARLAGIPPIGLIPKRRTAFNVPSPPGCPIERWPLVDDVGERFYFKADAGQLLVSPADATPSAPVDAQPEELDVAEGVDRLQRATTVVVTHVTHKWAGLRSFVADGSPVVGVDRDGFFWLAAQGGYGIKTSPALGRAVASLVLEHRLPQDLAALEHDLAPARLRR